MLNSDLSWAQLLRDRVIRDRKTIQHHIYSSLWGSIKDEFPVIMNNSFWLLGDGNDINFRTDCWCGDPLAMQLNIPDHISQFLSSKVSDFIFNGEWTIPVQLLQAFPALLSIVSQITIHVVPSNDKIMWQHTDDGDLKLKDAYLFKSQQVQELSWAKAIWSKDIPPSKSMLAWRIMHNKVPTNENLNLEVVAFLLCVTFATNMKSLLSISSLNAHMPLNFGLGWLAV
jgi:hypothetical protein